MVLNLKLTHFLFPEFSIHYFWTMVDGKVTETVENETTDKGGLQYCFISMEWKTILGDRGLQLTASVTLGGSHFFGVFVF